MCGNIWWAQFRCRESILSMPLNCLTLWSWVVTHKKKKEVEMHKSSPSQISLSHSWQDFSLLGPPKVSCLGPRIMSRLVSVPFFNEILVTTLLFHHREMPCIPSMYVPECLSFIVCLEFDYWFQEIERTVVNYLYVYIFFKRNFSHLLIKWSGRLMELGVQIYQ